MKNLKTYLIAVLGVLVLGAEAAGYLSPEQARLIETVLGFLGLAALRHGVAKATAPTPFTVTTSTTGPTLIEPPASGAE